MRKRFFAALLSFVMIFSLLPTSVLAADSGVIESALLSYETWLQGDVDAKPYIGDGILSSGKIQVGVGEKVQDKGGMTFGPIYLGSMGVVTDFNGPGGAPIVYNYGSDIVDVTVAVDNKDTLIVTFVGKKDGVATVKIDFGAVFKYVRGAADGQTCVAGLLTYNVTVGNGGSGGTTDPKAPRKPNASEVENFGHGSPKSAVKLTCDNNQKHSCRFTLIRDDVIYDTGYSFGSVIKNDDRYEDVPSSQYPWMCEMTVYASPFLSEYNNNRQWGGKYGTHYLAKNKPDTAKIMWFYGTDGSWYYDNTNVPVEFYITCSKPSQNEFTLIYNENAPTGKTADDVTDMPNPKEVKASDTSTSHTFTISSNVPKCEGYVFQGWSTTPDGTAAYQPKGEITISKVTNLYAVWHQHTDGNGDGFCDDDNTCMHPKDENTGYCKVDDCNHPHEGEGACCPKPSSEPSKPTEDQQKDMLTGKIKVTCVLDDENLGRKENEAHQPAGVYALEAGGYTGADSVVWNSTYNCWTYAITVNKDYYVDKFNAEKKLPHTEVSSATTAFTFKWDSSTSSWSLLEAPGIENPSATNDIWCEIRVKDVNKPDYDDLKDAIGKITVKDINTPDCGDKEYDLIANGTGGSGAMNWSEMRVNSDDGTAWKVVIHKAPYVEKYNGEMSYKEHVLVSDSKLELVVKYTAADGWKLASGQNAVIEVKHTATIPDPGANAFSNLKVQIKCDTKKDGSHDLQLSYSDGTYKFVRRTEPQYGYVVFTAADYLKTYNKTNPGHELKNAAAAVTWEFEYKDGKWQPRVDNKLPTIEVVCKDKPEIPSKTDVQLTTVKIQCVQPESAVKHNDSENAIAEAIGNHSNAYQLGAEVKQGTYNGETRYYVDCEITNITPYIADFNYLYSGHTEATEPEHVLKFKLWYCPENENVQGKHVWEADTVPTIYVKCEVAPSKPKDSDLNRTSYVEVVCDKNEHKTGTFTLSYGDYTVGNVEGDSQSGYTCTVTVKTEKYVNAYNETTNADNVKHVKVSEEVQLTFSYDAGTKTWKSDTKATIHTTHEKQDPKPDEGKIGDAIGDAQVMIQCEAKPSDHPTVEMRVGGLQNAQPNTSYQINGNIATVTINNPEAYAAEYKEGGADHTYKADGSRTTFTLKWSEDKEKGWGWYFEGAYALINTTCKTVTNQYTVSFDGNGGTGTMNSETVAAGSKYTLPACGFTAPDKKEFDAWEIDGTRYEVGASVDVNSNITVKALWKDATPAVTYLVTVKDSYAATTGEGRYEAGKTVTIHAGSRSNYRFDGWTTTSAGVTLASTSSKDTTFVMPANAVTVTANWTYIGGSGSGGSHNDSYTLRYDTNGGEKLSSESKTSKWTKDYEDLPIPTREGYRFNGWYYDSKLKNEVTGDVKVNTSVVTLYAGWTAVEVPSMLNGDDHFAYVQGYKDGNVRPYGLISRAETTTIFFRLLKDSVRDGNLLTSNTYTDVTGDYWANTAISTMTGLGIVQGRSADTFDPNAPITRAQFAAICARFDTGKTYGSQSFSDIQGHWAQAYIERAAELGWIKGFEDGTFRPDTYITRAQAMTMINRVLNRTPDDEDDLLDNMNVWPDCTPNDWFYLAVQEATNSHDFKYQGGEVWTKLTKAPDWSRYEH